MKNRQIKKRDAAYNAVLLERLHVWANEFAERSKGCFFNGNELRPRIEANRKGYMIYLCAKGQELSAVFIDPDGSIRAIRPGGKARRAVVGNVFDDFIGIKEVYLKR